MCNVRVLNCFAQIRDGRVKSVSASAAGELKQVHDLAEAAPTAHQSCRASWQQISNQQEKAVIVNLLSCMQEGWVFLDVRPSTEIAKVSHFTVQFSVSI